MYTLFSMKFFIWKKLYELEKKIVTTYQQEYK